MKIIYLVHQFLPYTFAGTEIYTYDLAKEMSRRGNYVTVVSLSHRFENQFPKYSYKGEFNFIKVKNKHNHLKTFKQILKDHKPDIVHIQHLKYFSPRIIEIIKAMDIPIILHLHDYFYICKRIRLLTRDGKICSSSRNCIGCRDRRSVWKRHIEDIDLILANSHFTRNVYIKSGFDPKKIIVNYPGIDTNRLKKIKHTKSNILRFAFLGTVIKEKGVEVLIDAFNKLDELVALQVWGRIDSYRLSLLKRIKSQNIEMKREYGLSEIKDILSGADIVIIPSIWPEPWSIIKTEALAAGLGVLASSIGGIPEGVCDKKVLLFNPNDVNSLLEAVESMIANKYFWKLKKPIGYGVKTIKEDAQNIEYIYTRLLAKKRKLYQSKKFILNSKKIQWFPAETGGIYISNGKSIGKLKILCTLHDVGKRFWELFTAFKSFNEIVRTISLEYNVDKKEVERDIKSFMDELCKEKIILEVT